MASVIYAQLDDQPLLLHLDFEDEDDIAFNEQDMTYDEAEPTAEYSTDAKIGTGAASFDGIQYIIMDVNEGVLSAQANNYTWAVWIKTEEAGGTLASWAPWSGTPADPNGPMEEEKDVHMAGVQALFWGLPEDPLGAVVYDVGWVDLFLGATAINDGAWHQVVLTNDITAPSQVIYVDGVAQTTGDIDVFGYEEPPDTPVEEFVLKVGYSTSGWPADEDAGVQYPYFTGVMDDFRMYGSALSADDVAELYGMTAVKGYSAELDFSVYPNPSSEFIMINSKTIRDLEIFNSVGQLVHSQKDVQNGAMISITDLGKGLYFVKSGDATQKLIIE